MGPVFFLNNNLKTRKHDVFIVLFHSVFFRVRFPKKILQFGALLSRSDTPSKINTQSCPMLKNQYEHIAR